MWHFIFNEFNITKVISRIDALAICNKYLIIRYVTVLSAKMAPGYVPVIRKEPLL